jgi:hypothetical protein
VLGAATAAARALRALRALKKVETGVYIVRALSGRLYVGQSVSMSIRLAAHIRSGMTNLYSALRAIRIPVSGGRLARRIMEQRMINLLGGPTKLENKRNEIDRRYWPQYGIRPVS